MAKLLMLYSTVDGHTLEITRRLAQMVQAAGHAAEVQELTPSTRVDLQAFEGVLIGASIRYGKHRPEVARFIRANAAKLAAMPAAFFSISALARKPEKRQPATNPYVRKLLATVAWQPNAIGIFGGRIAYPRYRFFDKHMIRFIMWITGGPTDLDGTFEFTDWDEVAGFGRQVVNLLGKGSQTGSAPHA